MIVEGHNALGHPVRLELTRLVVYDRHDNPVSVSIDLGDGWIHTAHVEDPDFKAILHELGIDCTVVVTHPPIVGGGVRQQAAACIRP